jgi:hypothetical protein
MNGGDHDLIGGEPIHQQADGKDIRNGIHRAHLVEVDFRYRNAVRMAFSLGNTGIHSHDVVCDVFGDRKVIAHDMFDIVQTAVMMAVAMVMVMAMVMLVVMVMAMVMLVVMVMVVMMLVVMRMTVMMICLSFFHTVNSDRHMGSGDTALHRGFRLKSHAREAERIEFLDKLLGIGQQFQESCRQHIAGGPHAAIKV